MQRIYTGEKRNLKNNNSISKNVCCYRMTFQIHNKYNLIIIVVEHFIPNIRVLFYKFDVIIFQS